MAARYAVTSGNWNDAIWAATVGGAAGSAAVPTSSDAATINSGVTVTLETTGCACLTLAVNGTLTATTSANWDFTAYNDATINSGGSVNIDMSASSYTGTIKLNGAHTASTGYHFVVLDGASCVLKGVYRNRLATLVSWNSSTSATVDDATGWQIGDIVVLGANDGYSNSTPKIDVVTLTSVNTGTGAIGWSGAATYVHNAGCRVGNFTSNLNVQPATAGDPCCMFLYHTSTTAFTREINSVAFNNMGYSSAASRGSSLFIYENGGSVTTPVITAISNNAFYLSEGRPVVAFRLSKADIPKSNNVIYAVNSSAQRWGDFSNASFYTGTDDGVGVFRGALTTSLLNSAYGVSDYTGRTTYTDIYAASSGIGLFQQTAVKVTGGMLDSNYYAIRASAGKLELDGVTFNNNTYNFLWNVYCEVVATDCLFTGSSTMFEPTLWATALRESKVQFINKNADVTSQEIYHPHCNIFRDNSNIYRSTSSVAIYPLVVSTNCQREIEIPCANGATIRVVGYVKKSHATNVSATVAISGLGTSVTPFTKANDTSWEQFDLSATNSSGADGILTLTYTANSSSGTTNVVYFDGVPDAPFVTKARHYGFIYDETNPARRTNTTINANESTAGGYTGISITGATSAIALSANHTFQEIYDYGQAWACTTANLVYDVPITGAGVAGSPVLFAVGNIDITGYTLSGSGSLVLGSATLTATGFSYTGGAYSYAASVNGFDGGTVSIGAAGTYTFDTTGTVIVSMTPTAPGTYVMGGVTASGQLDLRNTSGTHAITVELESGISYTTANNTGATITVSFPVVTADVSITSIPNAVGADRRLQIINTTAAAASAWQAATAYALGDVVLRTSGVGSESTAGLYMRCTGSGTSGGTEPTWDTTVGNTTADNTVTWTTYAVLFYDADPAASSYTTTYVDGEEFLAGEEVAIRCAEMDGSTSFKTYSTAVIAATTGFSALVSEESDTVFATYALDGSAYDTTFSPNYAANYIVLDTNTDFSGASAYAYYCWLLTTTDGMYRFWGGLTALDTGNIRNNNSVISLYFDESAGFVKQTDNVRIFRNDGARPAIDPTTGGNGIEINWRVPVNVVSTGGSALTTEEHDHLMSRPSASATASAVANVAVDGSVTLAESMRLQNSMLGGKVIGAGTGTEVFRSLADDKDRVTVTVDSVGNRSAVVRDLT